MPAIGSYIERIQNREATPGLDEKPRKRTIKPKPKVLTKRQLEGLRSALSRELGDGIITRKRAIRSLHRKTSSK